VEQQTAKNKGRTSGHIFADLRAENARLQEKVEKLESEVNRLATRTVVWASWLQMRDERDALQARVEEAETKRDRYKALAERRKEELAERDRMLRWTHGYLYRTPRTTVDGASVYRAIYMLLARAAIEEEER
jgi:hypothetical protein